MKINTVSKVGFVGIVGGGLVAAVVGFASPAQADLGHNIWASQQSQPLALAIPAGTDPLVPFGTNPQVPASVGHHTSNHDEVDTTNGLVDLPF